MTTKSNPQAAEELGKIDEAAEVIRRRLGPIPPTLIVAGSGLGGFVACLKNATAVDYGDLPHFPVSTVAGHAGRLVVGDCEGTRVIVMSGRKHLYEGVDPLVGVFALRSLIRAGVRTIVLSNAAGALNPRFQVGDLMLITDHINNTFRNPLIGGNINELGPRFPDMSEPYSRELQRIAREVSVQEGVLLREGVYIGNMGPVYETQAEALMFRQLGDVVGMSTVPETIAAVHAGARVLGISLVTNSLVLKTDVVTTHDEVIEAGKAAAETFNKLVSALVRRLASV